MPIWQFYLFVYIVECVLPRKGSNLIKKDIIIQVSSKNYSYTQNNFQVPSKMYGQRTLCSEKSGAQNRLSQIVNVSLGCGLPRTVHRQADTWAGGLGRGKVDGQ